MAPHVQRIIVVLVYADIAAARDFLVEAFGFSPGGLHRDAGGQVLHGEVTLGGETVRLHPVAPDQDLRSVAELAAATDMLHVLVEDADDHHSRATAAGAVVLSPPTDQPDGHREYSAFDSEGRVWSFASRP